MRVHACVRGCASHGRGIVARPTEQHPPQLPLLLLLLLLLLLPLPLPLLLLLLLTLLPLLLPLLLLLLLPPLLLLLLLPPQWLVCTSAGRSRDAADWAPSPRWPSAELNGSPTASLHGARHRTSSGLSLTISAPLTFPSSGSQVHTPVLSRLVLCYSSLILLCVATVNVVSPGVNVDWTAPSPAGTAARCADACSLVKPMRPAFLRSAPKCRLSMAKSFVVVYLSDRRSEVYKPRVKRHRILRDTPFPLDSEGGGRGAGGLTAEPAPARGRGCGG